MSPRSVSVLGGVILGRHDETAPLPRTPVHRLNNVHQLLLILHGPVDLVVVPRPQIDHDVLVAEEEHDGAGVVEFVHLVKVRHLRNIN